MSAPITSATANDIIRLALKMAGVLVAGQTPTAEDVNDSLTLLNSMIATWSQNRWLVYHLVDIACQSTGKTSYSVGPGADFNVTRPDRLQYAYARLENAETSGTPVVGSLSEIDYPLGIMQTHEEYAALTLKQLTSFPTVCFYDATFPQGTLYVWPIPSTHFELHILLKETLPQFTNLNQQFNLPPEYYEALLYNLAGRLQVLYRQPVDKAIVALADAAMNTIRVANHRVPLLRMPYGLSRVGGGAWPAHGLGGVIEGTFTLDQDSLG